ncbi:MAG: hypothetical protein ACRD6B_23780 [Bryobacteraceae bacterium]
MAHNHAQGFGYGQALAGFLLTVWAYCLGRKRLSQVPLALFCIAVALVSTVPVALGESPLRASPAVTYNRYGYALLALLLIEAFQGWRVFQRRDRFWAGFSTGAVIAILLFLKITYFACAIFLLVALLACQRQTKHRWTGLVTGFGAFVIAFCAYFRFDMAPMAHDLMLLSRARHFWFDYRVGAIFQDALLLAVFAAVAALLLYARKEREGARSIAIGGVAVAIAGALVIFGNNELSGFPLAVFLTIIIVDRVNVLRSTSSSLFHAAVLLLGSAFIIGSFASSAIGMSNGLYRSLWKARAEPRMDSKLLTGFIPAGAGEAYTEFVNDGLRLVKQYRQPGETVMCLGFSNPFSYGLGIPPAPGGTTVMQYRSTFDDTHRQSPQQLFGKADLVMLPKLSSSPDSGDSIHRLYVPYLKKHFRAIGKSRFWFLYRRDGEAR